MKQLWQDYKPVIILAAIAIPLCLAALIWVATDQPADPIRLLVPGELTIESTPGLGTRVQVAIPRRG